MAEAPENTSCASWPGSLALSQEWVSGTHSARRCRKEKGGGPALPPCWLSDPLIWPRAGSRPTSHPSFSVFLAVAVVAGPRLSGSRGRSRGLTRFYKTCLRFGGEAGWGLSTPFLLLLSQEIKFQSQQFRGKGLESKSPLKVLKLHLKKYTCVVFLYATVSSHSPSDWRWRTLEFS